MKIRGRGKTEKSADDTANKTVESRVYIKVNMKTSNGHYVLITGTQHITLLISDVRIRGITMIRVRSQRE